VTTCEPVPVTDARAQLSDLVGRVAFAGERVPLSRHGRVRAAIVSAEDLARLEALDEQADGSPPVVLPFPAPSGVAVTAPERTSIAAELAPDSHRGPQPGSPGSIMG
jgi:prevent-host-death family protein